MNNNVDTDVLPVVPSGCPKCHQAQMKRSNFRTGSVDKPGATVAVCPKCGHREEVEPSEQPTE